MPQPAAICVIARRDPCQEVWLGAWPTGAGTHVVARSAVGDSVVGASATSRSPGTPDFGDMPMPARMKPSTHERASARWCDRG